MQNMDKEVSVIIPTLNAQNELPVLLSVIKGQKQKLEIIIVDSESNDRTVDICLENKVGLIQIKRNEFDHGRTRDMALRKSSGDYVVFLTQDAVPTNADFITNLIAPLEDNSIAVSTGRQLPRKDATKMEQLVRSFNYPDESHVRSRNDLSLLGIKTFFVSDVCAAYNRKIYYELGGFDYPLKTNEDMFFAAKAINAGYRIAYAADALVIHSHNLSLREQYYRNFIQGYEIEKHKDALGNVSLEHEGMKLVKQVTKGLLKHGYIGSFFHFGFDCCARFIGSKAGKRAYVKEKQNAGDNYATE